MTRINIGILSSELCDQHLVAEYRELPRMIRLAQAWERRDASQLPCGITLGTGHMLSLVPFGWELDVRWRDLRREMERRGFRCTIPSNIFAAYPRQFQRIVDLHTKHFVIRPLLQERIRSRLATMRRRPTWTGRQRPEWARL